MQKLIFRGFEISSGSDICVLQSFNPNEYDVKHQEAKTFGKDGAEYYNFVYEPREVTCKGTLCTDNITALFKLRQEMMCVFDGKTKDLLTYENDRGKYTSMCFARVEFEETEATSIPFAVTFVLYNFYWSGETHKWRMCYENAAKGYDFAETITNNYAPAYPVITIRYSTEGCTVPSTSSTITSDKFIRIRNGTQILEMQYIGSNKEIITIDTKTMSVTSNIAGDLQKYLTIESMPIILAAGDNTVDYTLPVATYDSSTDKYVFSEQLRSPYLWYTDSSGTYKVRVFVTAEYTENLVGV